MTNYDLTKLNPREFEALSADIVSELENCRVERFREGKDGGIDGRFFSNDKEEVIIQCKHYAKSGISNLVNHLKEKELFKIKKLNPKRYILTTSLDLSPNDKLKIQNILNPYIISQADIFGKQDIADFLSKHPAIVRKHYKLWITSSDVILRLFNNAIIGRSEFKLEQIKQSSPKHVLTSNYFKAIEKLDKTGCLIIKGIPGIGKTTLADQILLKYASEGFEVCYLENSITEAEDIFLKENKQIFYFDDFLGSNILKLLDKHEDSHIVGFFRRIKNDINNKRFILTSRTVILNNAKTLSERFEIENINDSEYEIQISSLEPIDKAKILYNHIWHSNLEEEYINEIYKNKRYKEIIKHKNYNPRLISFITNQNKINDIKSAEYWQYIGTTLNNPTDIWDHVFKKQVSDLCAIGIYLTFLNGNEINEIDLKNSFSNMAIEENLSTPSKVETDFENMIKIAIGSVLNRKINSTTKSTLYILFDPSIGDYIIKKIYKMPILLEKCFLHLNTTESLKSLKDFKLNQLPKDTFNKILVLIVEKKLNSISVSDSYKIELLHQAIYNDNEILKSHLINFWPYFCKIKLSNKIIEICEIYIWYIDQGMSKDHTDHLIQLLDYFINQTLDHYECLAILKLSENLIWNMEHKIDYKKINEINNIKNKLKEISFEYWKNIINEEATQIIDSDILEYDDAYDKVLNFVNNKLSEFEFNENEIQDIIYHCDIEEIVKLNNEEQERINYDYDCWKESNDLDNYPDPIDELFQRD
jgi:hypothetical protein